jgi:hypothetical protein
MTNAVQIESIGQTDDFCRLEQDAHSNNTKPNLGQDSKEAATFLENAVVHA